MRAKGAGTQRADGTWQTFVTLTDPETGQKRRKCLYGATQQEVIEARAAALASGRLAPKAATVGQLLDFAAARHWSHLSAKERAQFEWARPRILRHLGRRRVGDLRPVHIAEAVRAIAADPNLSGRSVQIILNKVRTALRIAVEYGWIDANPALEIRLPTGIKATAKRNPAPTPDEVTRFLEAEINPTLRLFWRLLATTGLRPYCEALQAEPAWIEEHDGEYWIRVHRSKTASGRGRIVPLPADLARQLIEALPFRTSTGTPFEPANILKRWYATQARAHHWRLWHEHAGDPSQCPRPPRYTVYSLRNHRLTQWIAKGLPDDVIAALAGHTSVVLTKDKYNRTPTERLNLARHLA